MTSPAASPQIEPRRPSPAMAPTPAASAGRETLSSVQEKGNSSFSKSASSVSSDSRSGSRSSGSEDQSAGENLEWINDLSSQIGHLDQSVRKFVTEKPVATLLIATAVGLLSALAYNRFNRDSSRSVEMIGE